MPWNTEVYDSSGIISVPTGTFSSDAVTHADLGVTLGTMPGDYENYQMIRTVAAHINLDTTMSFSVDQATTLVYGHPTQNDHDTYKPSWLTSGNGWSDSGNTSTLDMPDAITASGTTTVTVKYYEKSITTGFSYAGFRSNNWDEVLGHYVGFFLIPSGITVSSIVPEIYELNSNISSAYSAPARDALYWDAAPSTTATDDTLATTWSGLETAIEGAGPGDVIHLQDGTYSGQGLIVINNTSGTAANPIRVSPETMGGAVLSGSTRIEFDNCDYIIFEGFDCNGVDGGAFGSFLRVRDDCTWISVRNCRERNRNSATANNFGFRIEGSYVRVSNCDIDSYTDGRQGIVLDDTTVTISYPRIDHNDITNSSSGASSGAAEAIQCGNEDTAATPPVQNGICDHNRVYNWDKPGETEAIGSKASGWVIMNNLLEDTDGDISMRFPADYLVAFNRFDNITNKSDNNRPGVLNGPGDNVTNGVACLNYTNYFSSVNGFWQPLRASAGASSSRRRAEKVLTVGDIVVDGDDQPFKTGTVSAGDQEEAVDLRYEGCSSYVTTDAFNLSDHAIQPDWTFSGCQIYGTTADPDSPTGNTYTNPNYSDRGDGIEVPTGGTVDYGNNQCFPGRLEGGSISNLGVTW